MPSRRIEIETSSGLAWVDLDRVPGGQRLLLIGHGAGGSVDSPDLLAVREHCLAAGISVARVTQPYRVAGRKAPPTAPVLDDAWFAVARALGRRRGLSALEFSFGGRSSGARVACRCAATGAAPGSPHSVVAIAFPVHPPGKPERSRLSELDAVPVPVLVVQGDRDPFGLPPQAAGRTVRIVSGDHGLKRAADEVGRLVAEYLSA
ncbi:hypothetical protein M6D93_07310 [Jatrophihabitans telluris]|uniref:KANL3/Tex30 alpha/beta hydrolase-like domain-containing protein n=1 Tax=Jatrophihabitans telluris TaxID=2038343 RepID=A0ABY4R390_9ACTN|nr:alpha/beta family hydrolase [Jatrophihabitans telluris]UQX89802.1 hypothetical protein M6D93_07310 [Jatrophihabitans telluris]